MKFEYYETETDDSLEIYEFISTGPKGGVKKIVQYSPTNLKNLYNLGFGDKDEKTGSFDDYKITNNGDAKIVLSTVVSTLFLFTDRYPERNVFAMGSTRARTRLYRMGISNNLDEVEQHFYILWIEKRKLGKI